MKNHKIPKRVLELETGKRSLGQPSEAERKRLEFSFRFGKMGGQFQI
jgi:hypothetical protein